MYTLSETPTPIKMYFKLTQAQAKAILVAYQNGTGLTLSLSAKQAREASEEAKEGFGNIPLNKTQLKSLYSAKGANRGVVLTFTKAQANRKPKAGESAEQTGAGQFGGIFFAIVPFLAALAPSLFRSAPLIAKAVKDGYTNIGKVTGIGKEQPAAPATPAAPISGTPEKAPATVTIEKSTGSSLETFGTSLQTFGAGVYDGASLKIFGENVPERTKTRTIKKKVSPIS